MNFAHALGFIILVFGFIMALGVGHLAATERPAKCQLAFTITLVFIILGEVLSRL